MVQREVTQREDKRHARGIVDTSVVVDLNLIDAARLPLYTRHPDDFADLSDLLHIVKV